MVFDFLTIDDVDVAGKTVFLRADINCPLDPTTKRIRYEAGNRCTSEQTWKIRFYKPRKSQQSASNVP